jgi:hypothetical protein
MIDFKYIIYLVNPNRNITSRSQRLVIGNAGLVPGLGQIVAEI